MSGDMDDIIAAGEDNPESVNINFKWMLTDLCNYKCTYCYAGYGHDTTRPISKLHENSVRKSWRSVIAKLSLKAVPRFDLGLLGGEPTLHPDIIEIIKAALSIPNLNILTLTTNLSKSCKFYTSITSSDKMVINISLHNQYINKNIVDKILILNKTHKIHVLIMLIDSDAFIDHVKKLVEIFEVNNVSYSGSYLFPTCTYKPNYSKKQLTEYDLLFTNKKKYRFKTESETRFKSSGEIITKKLNMFKDWKCSARSWEITTDGMIVNTCTRRPMDLLFKNTNNYVTCPHNKCECYSFWDYTKYKSI